MGQNACLVIEVRPLSTAARRYLAAPFVWTRARRRLLRARRLGTNTSRATNASWSDEPLLFDVADEPRRPLLSALHRRGPEPRGGCPAARASRAGRVNGIRSGTGCRCRTARAAR